MNIKSVVTTLLILFVGVSVIYLAVRNDGDDAATAPPTEGTEAADSTPSVPEQQTIAYYFHGDQRCPTCLKIEAQSEAALRAGFPEELADGRLRWEVINYETAGNEHYAEQFQLHTQTLILVDRREGRLARWRNLDKVWELVHDELAFESYVQRMTGLYVEGPGG